MDLKPTIESIVDEHVKRDGISHLMEWLGSTDFYVAPASTRYHHAHEGGLALHSLEVWEHLCKLATWYECQAPTESLAIVSLFHDVCKIGCYKTDMRWRKDANNKWEQYPTYKFEEDYPFGGHGSKSIYLIRNFIDLTPDEASAINSHMGAWDSTMYSNPSKVYETNQLAWLLHVADEASDFMGNGKE